VRPVIKYVLVFALGAIFTLCLTVSIFRNFENEIPNPFNSLPLIAPPVEATGGSDSTPPLNTSRISLIAYYKHYSSIELADTVPAFISYFDGGNYYDGIVRVWDSGTIGALSQVTDDAYVDVYVRVRGDGWTLAWFNRYEHDPGAIVWWGHTRREAGAPPQYATTLSRAIEIVLGVAGISFPGYDSIGLYDYSEPNATRLLVFGHSLEAEEKTVDYYYTIPANSTMTPIKMLIRAGGYSRPSMSGYPPPNFKLWVDDHLLYEKTDSLWGWSTYEIDFFQKGTQHSVRQYVKGGEDYYRIYTAYHSVAFILWAK